MFKASVICEFKRGSQGLKIGPQNRNKLFVGFLKVKSIKNSSGGCGGIFFQIIPAVKDNDRKIVIDLRSPEISLCTMHRHDSAL